MIKFHNDCLVDTRTGEIITKHLKPIFDNYHYDNWMEDGLRYLEPMTAQEADKNNIPTEGYIAEEKLDGHRSLLFITTKGNRLFSRRISKKTSWYAENSDSLPHIRSFPVSNELRGTVLDGEITTPSGIFAEVQGITGALPETALENQKEKGFAIFNAFDILYYKGMNVQAFPLWKRKLLLAKVVTELDHPCIQELPFYATGKTYDFYIQEGLKVECILSFKKLLEEMWERGKEGLIIKKIDARYEQKRSKSFLKLKGCLTFDVVIMGYQPATKLYSGKELEKSDEDIRWRYWETESGKLLDFEGEQISADTLQYCEPITKPYFMGWIGAIEFGVYKDGKLVKVGEAKGLTDADLEYIKKNQDKLIGTVIEIKAQELIDKEKGTLRHPRFNRWRDDKGAEQCTWEAHIRSEE